MLSGEKILKKLRENMIFVVIGLFFVLGILFILVLFGWISPISLLMLFIGLASVGAAAFVIYSFFLKTGLGKTRMFKKELSHTEAMEKLRSYLQLNYGIVCDTTDSDISNYVEKDIYGGVGGEKGARSPFSVVEFVDRYKNKKVFAVINRNTERISFGWDMSPEEKKELINSMAENPEEFITTKEIVPMPLDVEAQTAQPMTSGYKIVERKIPREKKKIEEEGEI